MWRVGRYAHPIQRAISRTTRLPLSHSRVASPYSLTHIIPCPYLSSTSCTPCQSPSSSSFPSIQIRGMKDGKRRKASTKTKYYPVKIPPFVSVSELASLMTVTMKALNKTGAATFPDWWPVMTHRNTKKTGFGAIADTVLSYDEAALLASKSRRIPELRDLPLEEDEWIRTRPFGPPARVPRPAIVSILGHKDHGKTTLLDKLRGGNLALKEEYGITQETYAFNVNIKDPRQVASPTSTKSTKTAATSPAAYPFSFLDTPGHISFSEMRANVANISDLILLVVAADEGVMDQTIESLGIAKQAERPLVVVINKCDLPGAKENIKQIREVLTNFGAKIHPPSKPYVSLTGDIVVVELSALHDKTELAELRSTLIEVTHQLRPESDPNDVPYGRVIESMMAPGRGSVLRVALTQGTLRVGQPFLVDGMFEGKVKEIRTMKGSAGQEGNIIPDQTSIKQIGPGITVDITGCSTLAIPGSEFIVQKSLEDASFRAKVGQFTKRYPEELAHRQQKHLASDAAPDEHAESYDAVEDVDELPADADEADDYIPIDEVPVDTDPRARIAPPLPPKSTWELSPPPPPTQRALPIANLRPKFKYYALVDQDEEPTDTTNQTDQVSPSPSSSPVAPSTTERRAGLNILLKTQNMGGLSMLRSAIDEMNIRNAEVGLPAIGITSGSAGDLCKSDLVRGESEGCWIYGFRIARPNKESIRHAKARQIPLFIFRHHQHLLDHLQTHIQQSPKLTEFGEAVLEETEEDKKKTIRRSHPTIQ